MYTTSKTNGNEEIDKGNFIMLPYILYYKLMEINKTMREI